MKISNVLFVAALILMNVPGAVASDHCPVNDFWAKKLTRLEKKIQGVERTGMTVEQRKILQQIFCIKRSIWQKKFRSRFVCELIPEKTVHKFGEKVFIKVKWTNIAKHRIAVRDKSVFYVANLSIIKSGTKADLWANQGSATLPHNPEMIILDPGDSIEQRIEAYPSVGLSRPGKFPPGEYSIGISRSGKFMRYSLSEDQCYAFPVQPVKIKVLSWFESLFYR